MPGKFTLSYASARRPEISLGFSNVRPPSVDRAYRIRYWSKGTPDKDVMELLGWTDLRSLKNAYQHADPETMLVTLQSRGELREAR